MASRAGNGRIRDAQGIRKQSSVPDRYVLARCVRRGSGFMAGCLADMQHMSAQGVGQVSPDRSRLLGQVLVYCCISIRSMVLNTAVSGVRGCKMQEACCNVLRHMAGQVDLHALGLCFR
jgi:hypothetical protein